MTALKHPALDVERVRLLAERSKDAVVGVLVGSALVVVVLWPYAPWPYIGSWALMFCLVNAYRILVSRSVLSGRREMTADVLTLFLGFSIANGVWLAALSIVFFAPLPLESKFALTVLILSAVAGGAATYASYDIGYVTFVALAIPPISLQWWRVGGDAAIVISITLVIFSLVMVGFSRYLVAVFNRSVLIRFDREKVVEELRAEQKLSELERRKAEEASAAKSRFLANASHDLRQPAQALALYTAVLQRSAVTEEQKEIASSISQTSRALAGLLDNLLDLSRLDANAVRVNLEATDLGRLTQRLASEVRQLATERRLALEISCPELVVTCDPVLLERTLRNLLHNAVKFTDTGSVSLVVTAEGQDVRIAVKDTGRGIAPEFQTRVFDEFFQVENVERDREKGLGLGLSIVVRLARLLDGRVELQSAVGEGATFTLVIPNRTASAPPLPGPRAPALNDDLSKVSILILDDDAMVRGALRQAMLNQGARVAAVGSLVEALDLASAERWDLCLCDLRLRGQEDGLNAATSLRACQEGLPIIFISGDTAPERIDEATRSGHPLLHKPVDTSLLLSTIGSLLSSKSRG